MSNAKPQRILVVDDDAVFRERLIRALTSRGYPVGGAGNADEALAAAQRDLPDRAIVDLRMPGKSGLDVVKGLVAIKEDMQVVVLTGYGSIATAVEAVRLGAIDYLTKPADAEQILGAFEKAGDPVPAAPAQTTPPSLARVEWEHIQRILTDCNGNISQAARRLRIHRRSLQRKLSKMPPFE